MLLFYENMASIENTPDDKKKRYDSRIDTPARVISFFCRRLYVCTPESTRTQLHEFSIAL